VELRRLHFLRGVLLLRAAKFGVRGPSVITLLLVHTALYFYRFLEEKPLSNSATTQVSVREEESACIPPRPTPRCPHHWLASRCPTGLATIEHGDRFRHGNGVLLSRYRPERRLHLRRHRCSRVVTDQASWQTDDNNIVLPYAPKRVDIVVVIILLKVFVLFVEHLLGSHQLDREHANPIAQCTLPVQVGGVLFSLSSGPVGRESRGSESQRT
jgi:hypothetical protein